MSKDSSDNKETAYQAVFETAVDSIIIIDKKGTVCDCNPALKKVFGYEPKDVIGKNVKVLIPSPYHEEHDDYLERYSKTGKKKIIGIGREVKGLRKDGSEFPLLLAVSETRIEGEKCFVGVIHDLSKQKKYEAQMHAKTRRLEAVNKELDDFAYITSHDLKAPLRAVATLIGWIEEESGESLNDKSKEYMVKIKGRLQRMSDLIQGVLSYSRAGKMDMECEEINVNQMLSEIAETLVPEKEFNIVIQENMPILMVPAVPFSQVFSNLISNGIKYHDKDTGKIEVGCKDQEEFYVFSVADDGPGIDPQYHDKIFGIFQTLEARDDVESTGIGLTIIKKIVESQNGKIWIESELGKGTTFFFTWPKTPVQKQEQPEQQLGV